MQTNLASEFKVTDLGREAESILRKCVHCGFCTATCPTYQLLGDELDGPRGRIYLIKQVLEGEAPTRATQTHLDRCLTCRNCETTCPSGVQYGHLIDIGREVVDAHVARPLGQRLLRGALAQGLSSRLFAPALALGRVVRPLLPRKLREKVPERTDPGAWPTRTHARKVLLPQGCVQPAMAPNIDRASARVLDKLGIESIRMTDGQARCCGAMKFHLGEQDAARAQMRANIDSWFPLLESGQAEAVVMNASGCGAMVKDYGHLFKHEPAYAERARLVSQRCQDLSELLPQMSETLRPHVRSDNPLVFHPPCTLQHGQQLRSVQDQLTALGFTVRVADTDAHLCCGSAGAYSMLQPEISGALRERKLEALAARPTETIVSANIGCITHLQAGTATPVRHWIEVLDQALDEGAAQ